MVNFNNTKSENLIEPEWDDVSEDAKDLVKRLLAYDPDKRITASDAI